MPRLIARSHSRTESGTKMNTEIQENTWVCCVNQAWIRARVTQPSPHIFLHICRSGISFAVAATCLRLLGHRATATSAFLTIWGGGCLIPVQIGLKSHIQSNCRVRKGGTYLGWTVFLIGGGGAEGGEIRACFLATAAISQSTKSLCARRHKHRCHSV